MSAIIKELEGKISEELQDKWLDKFNRRSGYKGNGIYGIGRLVSTDTRELFLMFVADVENIDYEGKTEEIEEEVE